jgi:hypothetical protein
MTHTTITLGGRAFPVAPLKLGQLRGLLDALDDLSGKTGGAMLDAAARVIQAGLARAAPDLTLDAVLDLDASMDEVTRAVATILSVAGLARPGEASPGEASPGEASPVASRQPGRAPNSPASTAPSPPAADIPSP